MALRERRVRRTSDRIEDATAWALVAAGLLVVLLSCAVGVRFHNDAVERGRLAETQRTPGVARLLSAAPLTGSPYASGTSVMVPATWQDKLGGEHTGFVSAPPGLGAGSTVAIWTDATGAKVPAPRSGVHALVTGAVAGGIALAAGLAVLLGVWALVRRLTMAANCARWEQEWREIGPMWTRGEGKPGLTARARHPRKERS